jgi:hypothetical protein
MHDTYHTKHPHSQGTIPIINKFTLFQNIARFVAQKYRSVFSLEDKICVPTDGET